VAGSGQIVSFGSRYQFDIEHDPGERVNLRDAERSREYELQLKSWSSAQKHAVLTPRR
jgi:hypothetical protein